MVSINTKKGFFGTFDWYRIHQNIFKGIEVIVENVTTTPYAASESFCTKINHISTMYNKMSLDASSAYSFTKCYPDMDPENGQFTI